MHPQGGDSSMDKEVMAILSSPGQQKLVKPQPRPGGLATAAASLRMPSSPLANGKAMSGTAVAAPGSSDYFSEVVVGGSGSGGRRLAEAALALEDSARNEGSGTSPPPTPVLPKSTGASWDPQVQSSSSAFSVPAGRGTGRGGRSGASPGVGGMGGAGLRGLTLGGFRVVGGDTADPERVGDGQEQDRQEVGGGRTPGPAKGLRYPLDSTLGQNALGGGVLREGKSSDVNVNAVEATRGRRGRYGFAHDEFRSDDTIFGGHGHQDHHVRSLSDPYSAPHEALGNTRSIGGGGKVGTGNSSSGVGLGRRGYDMPGLSGPLEGGVSTTTTTTTTIDTTSATSAAVEAAAAQQGYSMAKDDAEAMLRASESSSLDNWGILQYGLTLEGSMTGTTVNDGSGVGTGDAGGSDLRHSKEVLDNDSCGGEMGGGDSAGGNNDGDARRGDEPSLSSSSTRVEVMMRSLSLREQRYAREEDPRKGVPSTTTRSLLYSGRGEVQAGDRSHRFMRTRGQAGEDGVLADDYGLTTWPDESNSDFSLLRAQHANYPSESEARASALHQQQQQLLQNQQANSAPTHSRRAMGGSPSLAPMRRHHPSSSGNLESESFRTAHGANNSERTTAWHSGGGGGDGGVNDASGAGSEHLHWSFPTPGMGGHAEGVPADGDVTIVGNRLSGLEKDGDGSSGVDIGGGNGDGSGMRGGEVGEGHGKWGGMRSVLEREHGVSRRLVYGNAGNGGDSDAELATQRDLHGSAVDSRQFAMMRRQPQGIVETDNRMASGGDNSGGEIIVGGGDSRPPGQVQQYSLSQHPRFSKDSHQAALSASGDYDGRGVTVDREGTGGASVGGSCDVSGSGEHIPGPRARMSVRHHGVRGGVGMTGAPPGFPSMAYEYAEYTAESMEGHMSNGGTMSEDGRGVGRARRLPRDRPQQHEQQHMQDSLDEQQQHQRGGAPSSDHMQLRQTAGSRSLRSGGESMRSQTGGALLGYSEGHGWERGGRSEQGVGVSIGSGGDVDYADVYSTRRGAYGMSVGHRSSSGRQLGYDAGYDGHQGSGVHSGALYRGGSSSRSGGVDPSSRLAYDNIDGGEEALSYDVGVGGGGASQGFSRRYNGLSMGGQSGGYDNGLPQAGGDQSYRGGGGVRYNVADHDVSMGHRQQGSRDYQIHNDFQQQQQPARPGFSPPDRKKTRANLGYSPPEQASLPSALPRPQQQQQQQQFPQDDLPWSSAHQIHLQQHHSRGPSPQSYHPPQQYSQQQQPMQVKASSWSDSRVTLEIRSASGISGANYASTSTARRVGGGASGGHATGQNISTGGGGVGAPGSGIGDVYVRRRLPAPGPLSSEGGYGISSPRVNVGSGGAGTGGPGQQQLYSSSPSHASIQDRRMQGVQKHQQQQKGFREASPLRSAMNGPSSGLSVSMASGPAAPAPFSRSSSGPTSLSNSNKAHGLSAVGNVGAQVQSELGGVGSRGSSPHRPRMYPAEPPGLSAGSGRYGFVDGVSGGGVLSRGEGNIHRSMSHGAGVQGGFGRPPRQQQQQQQYGVQPHVKGPLHGTALRHPGGMGGGRGGGGAMIPVPGAPMDETQVKRAELVESPTTRLAFKDFYRAFRAKEKTSFHAAKMFAMGCFNILPPKVHWRLYLEIADLARRENRFVEARKLYQKVTKLQPFASQGWVEYCKLEEEFGDLSRCSQILRRGLTFCEYSETLLIKAVKQEERAGNLDGARELLSRLKHVGIDNVWRTVLEGALLEARSGNTDVARKVLKYLMTHVPWYGPIYYEAFRLEEKAEHFESALAIVERGLQEIPRYGPLWFGAFRLSEKLDMRDAKRALAEGQSPYAELYRAGKVCTRAKKTLEKAKDCISKELVWKVHFEAAQIEERLASVCAKKVASRSEVAAAAASVEAKMDVDKAKFSPQRVMSLGDTGSVSPPLTGGVISAVSSDVVGESDAIISGKVRALSLQEKGSDVRLESSEHEDCRPNGREIEVISEAKARDSLLAPCRASYAYAVLSCPQNLRWKVWLAGARMELAAGNCSHAQRLLNRAFQEVPEKSKSHVFLECARLEEFTGNLDSARQILERARVETKSEWKVFLESVLLEIRANDWQRAAAEAQEALRVHSGAGRLWAVLVQLKQRDSDEAQQASLKQALKEVPKSGEVWCEGARIHLNPLSKAFDLDTAGKYLGFAVQFTPQYGDSFMECLRLGLLNDLFLTRAKDIADVWQKCSDSDSAAESSPVLEGSKTSNNDSRGLGGLERGLDFISGELSDNGIGGRDGVSSGMVEGAREQVGDVDSADITTADVSVKACPEKSERRLLSSEVWAAIDAGENIPAGSGGGRGGDRVVLSGTSMETRTVLCRGEGNGGGLDSDDSRGSVKASGGISKDSEAYDKAKGGGSAVTVVSGEARRFKLSPREMAAASRVTEGDILRAHVEELLLRCVNADPNYGSMWFHCRHRPSDTAKSILMMAKVMMADELTKLQDVYLLAVTRHVILQREVDAYIASSTTPTMSNPAEEAGERTARRRHRKGVSRGRRREMAGERRERLLETAAKVAPPVGYDNPEGNLSGVRPEDFVTGLASLNRITAHMRRLRSEDRRKILFGSDQIVP